MSACAVCLEAEATGPLTIETCPACAFGLGFNRGVLSRIRKLAADQAEDEGLWFEAETAPESMLQAALRRLHAEIERRP